MKTIHAARQAEEPESPVVTNNPAIVCSETTVTVQSAAARISEYKRQSKFIDNVAENAMEESEAVYLSATPDGDTIVNNILHLDIVRQRTWDHFADTFR